MIAGGVTAEVAACCMIGAPAIVAITCCLMLGAEAGGVAGCVTVRAASVARGVAGCAIVLIGAAAGVVASSCLIRGATTAGMVAGCVTLGAAEEVVAGCMTGSAAEMVSGCKTVGAVAGIPLSLGLSIYRVVSRSSRHPCSMIVNLVILKEYHITSSIETKM